MIPLFPHENVREQQDILISSIQQAISKGKSVIAHAPTGLGKTAAALTPALQHVKEHTDTTIIYLTSRHTQHKIILNTINTINKKHHTHFIATSIIGKKWMCLQEGASNMKSNEFMTFCKHLREDGACNYYTNARGKQPNVLAELTLHSLKTQGSTTAENIITESSKRKQCPYEISLQLAEKAHVIIADYFYLFAPGIRENFLNKIDKKLEHILLIIDEGHNLPSRLCDYLTYTLSTPIIKGAITEAQKHNMNHLEIPLQELHNIIKTLSTKAEESIKKDTLINTITANIKDYDTLQEQLEDASEAILSQQHISRIGWIAQFLQQWKGNNKGFARIYKKEYQKNIHTLTLRCLDPALLSQEVLENTHSNILMSGTLQPPSMYKELLGINNSNMLELESPFNKKNKKTLIIAKTTTKYQKRDEKQYKHIAAVCAQICNTIPGNTLLFFPSYTLRDQVFEHFSNWYEKSILLEQPGLTKEEKEEVLNKYKSYAHQGSALLCASAGSFGEGIDLPGIIKGVLIIGLPLEKPDLETQERINYFDTQYGKGWDFGYLLPAMNKTFQNAGRCIRTDKDHGVIAFIDERYAWQNYKRTFPKDWNIEQTEDYLRVIDEFFEKKTRE